MNKALLLFVVLAGSVTCFADNVIMSCNKIGLLPVSSPNKVTIVAVPWCACSATDNEAISVSNIVKTANLTVGDKVYVMDGDGEKYQAWELKEGADGVKYWSPVIVVAGDNQKQQTAAADATAARGTAIVLERENPGAGPFYLYGQLPSATAVQSIVTGQPDAPVYNLISAPSVEAENLQTALVPGDEADKIVLQMPATGLLQEFKRAGGKWCYRAMVKKEGSPFASFEEVTPDTLTVAPGIGFWYVSYASKQPTFNWQHAPTKEPAAE